LKSQPILPNGRLFSSSLPLDEIINNKQIFYAKIIQFFRFSKIKNPYITNLEGNRMKTYEYYAEILEDGHLSIPENIRDEVKAKAETKIKVILMFDDEEKAWDAITMSQFLKGYSDKDAIYDNL
jgi:hypothetical protein